MGQTNLEGRLIQLEIERKKLADRLERALADIADLKQFRRTAPGLSWNGAGSSATPQYLGVALERIPSLAFGTASGDCAILKLEGVGGSVSMTLVSSPTLVYNGTWLEIVTNARFPVVQDVSGTWWAISHFQAYVGYSTAGVDAATDPPPSGTMGTGSGDVYGWYEALGYVFLGTYSLRNPHRDAAPADRALTLLPSGGDSQFTVISWT